MTPHKKYQEFIGYTLNDVTKLRYDDEHQALAYQLGLCQSILARLMLEDSKNYYIFKSMTDHARERAQRMGLLK
jgi:hypothetical protein